MHQKRRIKVKKNNGEVKKELYNYAVKKLEMRHESKRHVEIKSLYILQASTVLITLFTGLLAYSDNVNQCFKIPILILKFLFYILAALSILSLLISLDDTIANWFKKGKDGLYQDTLEADEILDAINKHNKSFFDNIIIDLSKSSKSANRIIEVKDRFMKFGMRLFIFSLAVLVILGIIIA